MTSVCIWGDDFRPWVFSFCRLIHLPLQILASGEISFTVYFPESILSNLDCPEGSFDPHCKGSIQNQNQGVHGWLGKSACVQEDG